MTTNDEREDTPEQTVQSDDPETRAGPSRKRYPNGLDPRLKYQKPYWWPYKTFVKQRCVGEFLQPRPRLLWTSSSTSPAHLLVRGTHRPCGSS